MNIAIYPRKSVYSDKSDSIEAQVKICKEYIANHFGDAHTIFVYDKDEGYTGSNTNRPDFKRMMNDIEHGLINMLICYRIDRISRDVKDFSNIFDFLQSHNVSFVSVKENIDTSTPLGRAMMYICSVFAQMERETISERVTDNMHQLAKLGIWPGGDPPIGYRRDKRVIGGKKHTFIVIHPEEAEFVRMIYDQFERSRTLRGLEKYFARNDVLSLNGKFLSSATLNQTLHNGTYVAATEKVYDYYASLGCKMQVDRSKFDGKHGVLVYGRKKKNSKNPPSAWEVSVGLHDYIIPDEQWLRVQKLFGQNTMNRSVVYQDGLLRGIITCKCGCKMRAKFRTYSNGRVNNYYICTTREKKGVAYCNMSFADLSVLDSMAFNKLKDISLNQDLLSDYVKKEKITSIKDIPAIKKKIKAVESKIDNLTSALSDSSGSSASKYIIQEIENLDRQLLGLKYELVEAEQSENQRQSEDTALNNLYQIICSYISSFETLDYAEKNRILKEIISECYWDGETLSILL